MRGHLHSRALFALAAVSAVALACLVVHSRAPRASLLSKTGLSKAAAALEKDIAHQHNLGSKVKAWVAASAMQAAPAQLKPQQQTQQLLGLAMPMALPHPQVRFSDTQQLTDEAKEATEANEVKEVAEDTVKTVAENAEHEAELEASVQEQGKMLKKLMGMVEKQHSAKKPTKAKAAAARPSAESQHEAELEATVEEQGKMIKKLMGMVNKPGMAAAKQGKAAPKTEAAPAKRQRSSAMPTLGSWDMAKAAGNDFGTNVVHLYSDLTTKGGGVQVKNPYSSGVSEAETARGEPDFSGVREEDTDYWNEDEPTTVAADKAARTVAKGTDSATFNAQGVAHTGDSDEAALQDEAAGYITPDVKDAGADEDDKLDTKPPLTSWDMAKFANNVEAGGGTMGTNVAYMYNSLSNKGMYKKVEANSPLDNDRYDDEFDEYKAKHGARGQALKQRFGNREHHIGPIGKKFAHGRV